MWGPNVAPVTTGKIKSASTSVTLILFGSTRQGKDEVHRDVFAGKAERFFFLSFNVSVNLQIRIPAWFHLITNRPKNVLTSFTANSFRTALGVPCLVGVDAQLTAANASTLLIKPAPASAVRGECILLSSTHNTYPSHTCSLDSIRVCVSSSASHVWQASIMHTEKTCQRGGKVIQSVIMTLQYRGWSHSAKKCPYFLRGFERNDNGLLTAFLFLDSRIMILLWGMFGVSLSYCSHETASMD